MNDILLINWEDDQAGFIVIGMNFITYEKWQSIISDDDYGICAYRSIVPPDEVMNYIESLPYQEYYDTMHKLVYHSFYNYRSADDFIFKNEFHPVTVGLVYFT